MRDKKRVSGFLDGTSRPELAGNRRPLVAVLEHVAPFRRRSPVEEVEPDLFAAKRTDSDNVFYPLNHERTVRKRVATPATIATMSTRTEWPCR